MSPALFPPDFATKLPALCMWPQFLGGSSRISAFRDDVYFVSAAACRASSLDDTICEGMFGPTNAFVMGVRIEG